MDRTGSRVSAKPMCNPDHICEPEGRGFWVDGGSKRACVPRHCLCGQRPWPCCHARAGHGCHARHVSEGPSAPSAVKGSPGQRSSRSLVVIVALSPGPIWQSPCCTIPDRLVHLWGSAAHRRRTKLLNPSLFVFAAWPAGSPSESTRARLPTLPSSNNAHVSRRIETKPPR